MSEMCCKRCGANEDRINGFCSVECEEYYRLEEEIGALDNVILERGAEVGRLTARVAELEAERRWRVVADGELPELGKEVIFYDSIMERRLKGCLRKNGGVEWLSDEGYTFSSRDGRYSRITHWMPLPKLPEVQDV